VQPCEARGWRRGRRMGCSRLRSRLQHVPAASGLRLPLRLPAAACGSGLRLRAAVPAPSPEEPGAARQGLQRVSGRSIASTRSRRSSGSLVSCSSRIPSASATRRHPRPHPEPHPDPQRKRQPHPRPNWPQHLPTASVAAPAPVCACGLPLRDAHALPAAVLGSVSGSGLRFRPAVPACGSGLRCRPAVPACGSGLRFRPAVPACGSGLRLRPAVPACGSGCSLRLPPRSRVARPGKSRGGPRSRVDCHPPGR
jgi:hypothetical protein